MKYIDIEDNTHNKVSGNYGAFFWSHSKNQISKAETMEQLRILHSMCWEKLSRKKIFSRKHIFGTPITFLLLENLFYLYI